MPRTALRGRLMPSDAMSIVPAAPSNRPLTSTSRRRQGSGCSSAENVVDDTGKGLGIGNLSLQQIPHEIRIRKLQ